MANDIVPDAIDAYAAAHTTPVPPLLEELGAVTEQRFGALSGMLSGQVPGALLQMLIFVIERAAGAGDRHVHGVQRADDGGCAAR